jgi:regulator of sigma E protease
MLQLILFGIPALGLVVLVHELGHFLMARACGVPVDRFSIGFGPKLLGIRRGRTEYVLAAFPLGGYVKMAGEEALEEGSAPGPDTFLGHPWWHRVLIALAGPGANFIFAFVVLSLLYMTGVRHADSSNVVGRVPAGSTVEAVGFASGDRIVAVDGRPATRGGEVRLALAGGEEAPHRDRPVDLSVTVERNGAPATLAISAARLPAVIDSLEFHIPPVIGEVVSGTPAYVAGLQDADRVVAVNGTPITEWSDLLDRISNSPGVATTLTVQREGRTLDITVTPAPTDEPGGGTVGRIGVVVQSQGSFLARYPVLQAIEYGATHTVRLSGAQFQGIIQLFTNLGRLGQSVSGPLAIMEMTGRAAQQGLPELFQFIALISIALMAFNLLPVPVLDGGLVVMALAEGIRRRPVPMKVQIIFQQVGLVLLGSLILFVVFNDPLKMIRRNRALSRQEAPATAPASTAPTADPGTTPTGAPAATPGTPTATDSAGDSLPGTPDGAGD